jgi:hypothetical protein
MNVTFFKFNSENGAIVDSIIHKDDPIIKANLASFRRGR